MKEWVTIAPHQSRQWGKLAEEARAFVAAPSRRS
jgi:hypothetical protein